MIDQHAAEARQGVISLVSGEGGLLQAESVLAFGYGLVSLSPHAKSLFGAPTLACHFRVLEEEPCSDLGLGSLSRIVSLAKELGLQGKTLLAIARFFGRASPFQHGHEPRLKLFIEGLCLLKSVATERSSVGGKPSEATFSRLSFPLLPCLLRLMRPAVLAGLLAELPEFFTEYLADLVAALTDSASKIPIASVRAYPLLGDSLSVLVFLEGLETLKHLVEFPKDIDRFVVNFCTACAKAGKKDVLYEFSKAYLQVKNHREISETVSRLLLLANPPKRTALSLNKL